MVAYATYADVQARITRTLSTAEQGVCTKLLEDAGVMIDAIAPKANYNAKKLVSIRMAIRALGDGGDNGVPIGATQGSMSGLGYSQSWTISGGTTGELYLSKADKNLLRAGNNVGSYSPVQEMAAQSLPMCEVFSE